MWEATWLANGRSVFRIVTDVSRLGVSRDQPSHTFETVLLGQPHRPTQISGIRSRNFDIGLFPFTKDFDGALQRLYSGSLTADALAVQVDAGNDTNGHHSGA